MKTSVGESPIRRSLKNSGGQLNRLSVRTNRLPVKVRRAVYHHQPRLKIVYARGEQCELRRLVMRLAGKQSDGMHEDPRAFS